MPSQYSRANPSKIFISYRRSESAAHAGRLSDQLRAHFGSQIIFIDIESIEPGTDFVEAIEDAVSSCKILLAVIGQQWLACANEHGRRLDDPKDFVRLEIAAALKRGIRVIPVLVQGAAMPREQDLPDDIANLARRQAWEMSELRWGQDARKLIEKITEDIHGSVRRTGLKHLLSQVSGSKIIPFKLLLATVIPSVIAAIYVFWPGPFAQRLEPPRPCLKLPGRESHYYEAEDAVLSGGTSKDSQHSGFSGDGFVSGYGDQPGATTTFLVDAPSDGQYQVDLCYANGTNSAKTLTIYVNEEPLKQIRLPNASQWDFWLTQTESLPLKAGRNSISYLKTSRDNGQVNLDFIGIVRDSSSAASPQPTTTPNVGLSGVVVDSKERPLQGARVTLEGVARMSPVETSSDGQFNMETLPLKIGDRVMLRVVLEGYKPNPYRKVVVIGNYPPKVELTKEK
jgi:hypothetical protein